MKLQTYKPRKPKQATRQAIYCIEGVNITLNDMAARLGVSRKVASSRLSHIKQYHPAVTWALLGQKPE